jgi:hypothetical protein
MRVEVVANGTIKKKAQPENGSGRRGETNVSEPSINSVYTRWDAFE